MQLEGELGRGGRWVAGVDLVEDLELVQLEGELGRGSPRRRSPASNVTAAELAGVLLELVDQHANELGRGGDRAALGSEIGGVWIQYCDVSKLVTHRSAR